MSVDNASIESQVGQFDAGQVLIFGEAFCKYEPFPADAGAYCAGTASSG